MQIPVWTAADLSGVDQGKLGLKGSPTQVVRVFNPPKREGKVEIIHADSVDQAAAMLADKLLAEKVI